MTQKLYFYVYLDTSSNCMNKTRIFIKYLDYAHIFIVFIDVIIKLYFSFFIFDKN